MRFPREGARLLLSKQGAPGVGAALPSPAERCPSASRGRWIAGRGPGTQLARPAERSAFVQAAGAWGAVERFSPVPGRRGGWHPDSAAAGIPCQHLPRPHFPRGSHLPSGSAARGSPEHWGTAVAGHARRCHQACPQETRAGGRQPGEARWRRCAPEGLTGQGRLGGSGRHACAGLRPRTGLGVWKQAEPAARGTHAAGRACVCETALPAPAVGKRRACALSLECRRGVLTRNPDGKMARGEVSCASGPSWACRTSAKRIRLSGGMKGSA